MVATAWMRLTIRNLIPHPVPLEFVEDDVFRRREQEGTPPFDYYFWSRPEMFLLSKRTRFWDKNVNFEHRIQVNNVK